LGSSNFLERFQVYVAHVQEWRSQFSRLDAIDLRYAGQVIVNPESSAPRVKQGGGSPDATVEPATSVAAPKNKIATQKKAKKH